jgi:hypothetical protein
MIFHFHFLLSFLHKLLGNFWVKICRAEDNYFERGIFFSGFYLAAGLSSHVNRIVSKLSARMTSAQKKEL